MVVVGATVVVVTGARVVVVLDATVVFGVVVADPPPERCRLDTGVVVELGGGELVVDVVVDDGAATFVVVVAGIEEGVVLATLSEPNVILAGVE